MKKPTKGEILDFLNHSNRIEGETSELALRDAERAWRWAIAHNKNYFSLPYILMVHKLLMRNLRPTIAGELRKVNVRVGSRICPDYTLVSGLLNDWIKDSKTENIRESSVEDEIIKGKHIIFEEIHPFVDGNGRTGRILYNIQRLNAGLPIHIIHVGKEQEEYYSWFDKPWLNHG